MEDCESNINDVSFHLKLESLLFSILYILLLPEPHYKKIFMLIGVLRLNKGIVHCSWNNGKICWFFDTRSEILSLAYFFSTDLY